MKTYKLGVFTKEDMLKIGKDNFEAGIEKGREQTLKEVKNDVSGIRAVSLNNNLISKEDVLFMLVELEAKLKAEIAKLHSPQNEKANYSTLKSTSNKRDGSSADTQIQEVKR